MVTRRSASSPARHAVAHGSAVLFARGRRHGRCSIEELRMALLDDDTREAIMARPRPVRALPVFGAPRLAPPLGEPRPEDDRWRPVLAVWETTLRCDLACRHCGSRAGHARPDELSTAECLDLVRQLAELGTREVAIIGGEAYLRGDWLDILRAIKAHGMLPTMTTGGRNLTAERARDAAAAGLFSASVSIDGDEPTHDRLRGVAGSYRSAFEAMANLRQAGVHVTVNTQINRLGMPHLSHVLDRMIEAGARSWMLQLTVAMGRAADEPDVLLQPYDLLELFPLLAALKERAARSRIRLIPGSNVGYFGPYEAELRGTTRCGHSTGCGAGRASIGIEADGTIKGCPSLPSQGWAGGNVRQTPLAEIWKRATALRYTRDRTVKDLWGYCATCYYADACKAGCTWTTDVLFGRPGNNPYCHHRALEMQAAGKRERVVRVEAPPGEPFDHGKFELVVEDAERRAAP
jgi:radical SAM protein with 4Fe4S-binding SPASM domain